MPVRRERYFEPDLPVSVGEPAAQGAGRTVALTGGEAHHLAKVRRQEVGEWVELFNGQGASWLGVIRALAKDRVTVTLEEIGPADLSPLTALTLVTAAPKGERLDWLVEKAVELGVKHLVLLKTARSVVDPRTTKLDRLRKSIIEASKQCRRNTLMSLAFCDDLADYLQRESAPFRWLADPDGVPLHAYPIATTPPQSGDHNHAVLIGPEGGFTAEEIARIQSCDWKAVRFTKPVLRIETAAIAAAAALLSWLP